MATQATGLAGPIGRGPAGDRVGDVVVIVIPFATARFTLDVTGSSEEPCHDDKWLQVSCPDLNARS